MPDNIVLFDDKLEARIRKEFGEEATPEFMNMVRAGKAAYEHGYHGFIHKREFLGWIEEMYDAGKEQREVRNGKKHGRIIINSSDVMSAAAHLALHGKRRGYLSR